MASHRMSRLSEDIMRELCAIIRRLKDPRIDPLLSVVKVEVTNDLSYATCYVSCVGGMEKTRESVKGLRSAAGFIRRELAHSLRLRSTPEIRFVADDSIEHSAKISRLISEVMKDVSAEEGSEAASDADTASGGDGYGGEE